jgi:hypothetical protein
MSNSTKGLFALVLNKYCANTTTKFFSPKQVGVG